MNILPTTLLDQYYRAVKDWPFITTINDQYGLPTALLHAIGSRETNLTNELGDGGHGHGIFQLDDRFHIIPPNFDDDISMQTTTAAGMLQALGHQYNGNWLSACNAYNSGSPLTTATAGGNYGTDVLARRYYLVSQITTATNITEGAMIQNFPQTEKSGELKLIIPTGPPTITARAWLSMAITIGTGHVDIFIQTDDTGITEWKWELTKDVRYYSELPPGTRQLTIQWALDQDNAHLGIAVETLPMVLTTT